MKTMAKKEKVVTFIAFFVGFVILQLLIGLIQLENWKDWVKFIITSTFPGDFYLLVCSVWYRKRIIVGTIIGLGIMIRFIALIQLFTIANVMQMNINIAAQVLITGLIEIMMYTFALVFGIRHARENSR
jgi:hypothetical protein